MPSTEADLAGLLTEVAHAAARELERFKQQHGIDGWNEFAKLVRTERRAIVRRRYEPVQAKKT